MTRRHSFIRKLVYAALIIPLLYLTSYLGQPSIIKQEGVEGETGGVLAQLQTKYEFSPVELGKIDPASETIKLVTFGMRGPAANWLAWQAQQYQMKKDWTNLTATLEQLIKIQPNFVDVWIHQGWNLAYNCSVQFDDYRERYRWVIKGINFLNRGRFYNTKEPKLIAEIARVIAYKIGRADEHEQFRRLFRNDDEFNKGVPRNERDNWLIGKKWYRKAEEMVDNDSSVRKKVPNPRVFFSKASMCQLAYADTIEKEGTFGEKAKKAWEQGGKDWVAFGKRDMPTTDGRICRLGEWERYLDERDKLIVELEALAGGAAEELVAERMEKLTPEQLQARAIPTEVRTYEQQALAQEAETLLHITPEEVARLCDDRQKANKLVDQIAAMESLARLTKGYRGVVNYEYWAQRAAVEQSDAVLEARKTVYYADKALAEGDIPAALQGYRSGSAAWARVLAMCPFLLPDVNRQNAEREDDDETVDALEHLLTKYATALDIRNELFPEGFPLDMPPGPGLTGAVEHLVLQNYHSQEARRKRAKAQKALAENDLPAASQQYKDAMTEWFTLIDDLPHLEQMSCRNIGHEILQDVDAYAKVLGQLKLPVPVDFPLKRFMWVQITHDPATVMARQKSDQGAELVRKKDWAAARQAYEESLARWWTVVQHYPTVAVDRTICEEIQEDVDAFIEVNKELGQKLPDPFPLRDFLEKNQARLDDSHPTEAEASE